MENANSTSSIRSHVRIAGTGSYLPEKVLTNADLEKTVDTSDEWITSRTGIRERRIAGENEFTSHLAAKAGKRALEQAGLDPSDLDLIVVATITPDTLTPATACYVQQLLGSQGAVAFDVSAACSGFLYALEIAKSSVASGAFRNALIIGAEKLSAFVNWEDRNTCVLFGDGAGAAVLLPSENGEGKVLSSHLGTDGAQAKLLHIPGGGSACPITINNAENHLAALAMSGKEVFKHAVTAMRRAAETALEDAGVTAQDIKLFIPHQANLRIIYAITERMNISKEDVYINLDKYGNTSAAAVAIALDEAHREGRIERGDKILLFAFGAGLTWASAVIEW